MQSGSTIDAGFICCATCRYWTGYTEYHFPGTMTTTHILAFSKHHIRAAKRVQV